MKKCLLIFPLVLSSLLIQMCKTRREPLVFATFAETKEELNHTLILAESVRTFAGTYQKAPVWIFTPESLAMDDAQQVKAAGLNVVFKTSGVPEDALWFYYSRKVFAAAQAETDAAGRFDILAWLDEDTIFLREPKDFLLPEGIHLGYRPVMHRLIASLWTEPVDEFWDRVYSLLGVQDKNLFAMTTPADHKTIKAYFNAGLLVLRPEKGILRSWPKMYSILYTDSALVEMSRQDIRKRIFLHQVALSGAILTKLKQEEMTEYSLSYNYPLFFKEMFGGEIDFGDLGDVVTMRYDAYFRNPAPDWADRLQGPPELVAWLKMRLGK